MPPLPIFNLQFFFAFIKLDYFKNQHFSFFLIPSQMMVEIFFKKVASFSSHFSICDNRNVFIWIGWGSYLRKAKIRRNVASIYSRLRLKENVSTSTYKLEKSSLKPTLSLLLLFLVVLMAISFWGDMVRNFWREKRDCPIWHKGKSCQPILEFIIKGSVVFKAAFKFLRCGGTGPCELPDLGAGNQTWVLYKMQVLLTAEPFLQPLSLMIL